MGEYLNGTIEDMGQCTRASGTFKTDGSLPHAKLMPGQGLQIAIASPPRGQVVYNLHLDPTGRVLVGTFTNTYNEELDIAMARE